MCSIDGAEDWDIYSQDTFKAIKNHQCDECRRTIRAGESYRRCKGLLYGSWYLTKQCEHCQAAGSWLVTVCGGYLLDGVIEELRDHWDEGYQNMWMGRVIVGARRKWTRRDGSLMPVPECVTSLVQATRGMPDYLEMS